MICFNFTGSIKNEKKKEHTYKYSVQLLFAILKLYTSRSKFFHAKHYVISEIFDSI